MPCAELVEGRERYVRLVWRRAERPLFLLLPAVWVCVAGFAVWRPYRKLQFPPFRFLVAAAAAAGVYFLLARLLNRTTFRLRGQTLSVEHGPLPSFRSRVRLPLSRIAAVTHSPLTGVGARLVDGPPRVLLDDFSAADWEQVARLVGALCQRPAEPST